MTKQELANFISKHRDKIGTFYIALDERFEGQFTLDTITMRSLNNIKYMRLMSAKISG
ncbi:hypothetical protein MK435_02810 [Streptococcus oralis]|nr:hypothetical protein [Streptococcus oralis]MCY7074487.1 hypothetical protein [Streptococcus oralis]MCY7109805.1 hypothetical protein [Streptococcus oralis]